MHSCSCTIILTLCLSVGVCSHMTRWYSRVVMQSRGEELVRGLKLCLQAAVKKFHEVSHHNNKCTVIIGV